MENDKIELNMKEAVSVAQYYKGKNIFLTGSTGFLGKVFLEKLLRSCPDVGKVYCLLRHKRGVDENQRFENLCKDKIFSLVEKTNPNFQQKIQLISGNICETSFGMSERDMQIVRNNVHIIFHVAASVKFNMTIREAVTQNVRPVMELVNIAKTVQNLEALVHISTAYANCDKEFINEEFYATRFEQPEKILDIVNCLTDEGLEKIKSELLGAHPNTYTFTKQLAEHIISKEAENLPIIVIRPSMICSATEEPFEGFIDQLGGLTFVALAYGKGLLRTNYGKKSVSLDIIPVDYCANVMIASAWYHTFFKTADNGTIYQPTSGMLNPITLQEYWLYKYYGFKKWPMNKRLRTVNKDVLVENRTMNKIRTLFRQNLVVRFVDSCYACAGKKSKLTKTNEKLVRSLEYFEFFETHSFSWAVNNIERLQRALSPEDKVIFPMDVRNIEWVKYIENFIKGIQLYLLGENIHKSNNEQAEGDNPENKENNDLEYHNAAYIETKVESHQTKTGSSRKVDVKLGDEN